MKVPEWKPGMTVQEEADVAYTERNLLALLLASRSPDSGWYVHGEWEGYARVISLYGGTVTFHVPDDFDLGTLPQIENNWNGHSTPEKWRIIMASCGIDWRKYDG